MRDLFTIDYYPITAPLLLACPEPRSSLQDVYDRPDSAEYLVFFGTLWHGWSLLQPDLFQHMMVNATHHSSSSSMLPWPWSLSSDSTTTSIWSIWAPPSDICKRLVSAWQSHPTHVFVLTSPHDSEVGAGHDNDPLRVGTSHKASNLNLHSGADTLACGYLLEVVDEGRDESMDIAWIFDVDSIFDDDGGRPDEAWVQVQNHDAPWDVNTCTGDADADDGSSSHVWIALVDDDACRTRTTHAFRKYVRAAIGAAFHHRFNELSCGLDICQWLGQDLRCRARASGSRWSARKQTATATALQDPHEAHGVGVVVKALVQQNAGAVSLFLRAVAVCVAAFSCCVHSMLALGERSSSKVVIQKNVV